MDGRRGVLSVKEELNEDHTSNFMDLSAIGCSLLLDQQQQQADTSITVTMTGPPTSARAGNYRSSYLCPAPPPPYPGGLTPYQTPYVSPYATPFQTPSPSPLSSVQSSPATSGRMTKEPGIDQELAMILESDPFIWEQQEPANQSLPPPPYPHADRVVTGRPPHPRPSQTQPSRTQLKQQLQRQQLEQQEHREREMMNLQSGGRASSCPVEKMGIPIISQQTAAAVEPVSVPPQVLTVRTRLENPTLYHVIESRRRQVREFLQQEHSLPHDQRSSTTASSAPPGGFVVASQTQHPSEPTDTAEVHPFF